MRISSSAFLRTDTTFKVYRTAGYSEPNIRIESEDGTGPEILLYLKSDDQLAQLLDAIGKYLAEHPKPIPSPCRSLIAPVEAALEIQ